MSALVLFGLALAAIQVHKSGVIRRLLAKSLRRKVLPQIEALIAQLVWLRSINLDEYLGSSKEYYLRRIRADLEAIFAKSWPLLTPERQALEKLLLMTSKISHQIDSRRLDQDLLDATTLHAQRTLVDLQELNN